MTETTATLEALAPVVVKEPGVYPALDELVYHRDPVPEGSLSVSGAKKLLPPSSPALFKWDRDNGQPARRQFEFGHAAHKLVLGVGLDVVVIDAENYRTKKAQETQAAARAAGTVPLLAHEWATVQAMAAALRGHPIASVLLADSAGTPEVSLFWRDTETGVMRRGRLDLLPHPTNGRLIIVDYKSAVSASPQKFRNAAADYGYHMQAPNYIDGVLALNLAEDAAFVFVVQEKTPPYLVSVVELDSLAMRIGRHDMRKALDIYVDCMTTDTWPGYADDDVALVSLPGWVQHRYAEETS
jgi:hypothetical protein